MVVDMMKVDNLVTIPGKLTYKNDWEYDQYFVDGKRIRELHLIEVNGVQYDVDSGQVSVPYDDMGHTYTATSTHFFVEVEVLGVKVQIDLNRVVKKQRIKALAYEF